MNQPSLALAVPDTDVTTLESPNDLTRELFTLLRNLVQQGVAV